jgi:hypothetical protein
MRQLRLKRILTIEQDKFLRGAGDKKLKPLQPKLTDYDPENFVRPSDGETQIFEDDGSLLAWIIPNAFELDACQKAYDWLKRVRGDAASRPEVVGEKNERRVRGDSSLGKIQEVPQKKRLALKRKGIYADFLGFMDKQRRFPYCRKTAWTIKNPRILRGVMPLINAADRIFEQYIPDRHYAQSLVESIDFTIGATAFSTLTVNRKLASTYHRDEGDLKTGFGVMFTLGKFTGGQLVFPAFRCAVDYQPGSIILADVHETHGNVNNIVGDRITCILYKRAKIGECGTAEEEQAKAAGMSIHARED